ncbi:hypothetical protein MSAN_00264700 [Mycena sanguinolenta]|uniref:F-box domain-containing protein n=1 Tax=Mycena sanguinolenta TaxID=230812 RepID=A0A8H6ZG68_9AGAR|nr:hypothetical protein MSAN_00264700 [Mycena sanguinolenta]
MGFLPQELIDAIVKLVPDKTTLLACSLTAPSFVVPSQRRIFHWISIQNATECERLAGILTQSPQLGPYVKRLALKIHDIPADSAPLALILSTTNRVERLVIRGRIINGKKIELTSNPSLIAFLSLESLLCVGLVKLGDVSSSIVTTVLERCEEVCLSEIDIVLEGEADESAGTPSRSIFHLDVYDRTNTIVSFLALPRQLCNLASITYLSTVSFEPSPSHHSLLTACAPTLEILEIVLDGSFALPTLPCLWHLELRTHGDITMTPAALPSAIEERSQAHSFNWGILDRNRAPEWSLLDKRLCEMHTQDRSGNVPKLVDVHFSLRYCRDSPWRYADFVADVKTRLPRVLEAGFLTFSHRESRYVWWTDDGCLSHSSRLFSTSDFHLCFDIGCRLGVVSGQVDTQRTSGTTLGRAEENFSLINKIFESLEFCSPPILPTPRMPCIRYRRKHISCSLSDSSHSKPPDSNVIQSMDALISTPGEWKMPVFRLQLRSHEVYIFGTYLMNSFHTSTNGSIPPHRSRLCISTSANYVWPISMSDAVVCLVYIRTLGSSFNASFHGPTRSLRGVYLDLFSNIIPACTLVSEEQIYLFAAAIAF